MYGCPVIDWRVCKETDFCAQVYERYYDEHKIFISAADAHVVPGGEFPVPSAAAALMTMMPPPECFHVSKNDKEISK